MRKVQNPFENSAEGAGCRFCLNFSLSFSSGKVGGKNRRGGTEVLAIPCRTPSSRSLASGDRSIRPHALRGPRSERGGEAQRRQGGEPGALAGRGEAEELICPRSPGVLGLCVHRAERAVRHGVHLGGGPPHEHGLSGAIQQVAYTVPHIKKTEYHW